MKILMVIDSLRRGGRERRLIELLKGLQDKPEITTGLVVFSRIIDYPEIHKLDVPIHILERKPRKDPRVFFRFYRICRQFRPDIVHSWGTMSSIFAIPSIKMLGIKFINANIVDAPPNMRFFDKRLFRARLTFPFSQWVLANSYAGLKAYRTPQKKSLCIHNGFDLKRLQHLEPRENIRQEWGINTPKVVGMVGAFEKRKDYRTYIRAAIAILEHREDVCFLAIGDGNNRAGLEAMVPEKHKAKLLFTGNLSDVEPLINLFDIGILTTNVDVHGEGISNSIMEYMALGKPVIATESGGTSEIVQHEKTGFLIPHDDHQKLQSCILYLLDHPEEALKMGTAGKERIMTHFNLEKMTRAYCELYKGGA